MKKIVLLLMVIGLFACKKNKPGTIRLQMNHNVAGETVVLNQQNYTSPVGHDYQVTKLWYYISDISFGLKDGSSVNKEGGHLIKLEDENSFTYNISDLEPGTYNKIQFQFGIAKSLNEEAYLENTQDNQNMSWPSQLGPGAYHYMKFEGKYDSLNTGTIKNFVYHAGPTNGNENSFNIVLSIDEFEIDDNSYKLNINVDLQEWFQNPTTYDFKLYKDVMMHQNIQEIYKENGASVFSLGELIMDAK